MVLLASQQQPTIPPIITNAADWLLVFLLSSCFLMTCYISLHCRQILVSTTHASNH